MGVIDKLEGGHGRTRLGRLRESRTSNENILYMYCPRYDRSVVVSRGFFGKEGPRRGRGVANGFVSQASPEHRVIEDPMETSRHLLAVISEIEGGSEAIWDTMLSLATSFALSSSTIKAQMSKGSSES